MRFMGQSVLVVVEVERTRYGLPPATNNRPPCGHGPPTAYIDVRAGPPPVEPPAGRGHWRQLTRALEELEPGWETHGAAPLRAAVARMRRRGLDILLSNLLVDPDVPTLALREWQDALSAAGMDCLLYTDRPMVLALRHDHGRWESIV